MTLALYGKSRKRQGGLLLAAFLAVIAASLGGLAVITSAFAHHVTAGGTAPTCQNAGGWNYTITTGGWGSPRIATFDPLTLNAVAQAPEIPASWRTASVSPTFTGYIHAGADVPIWDGSGTGAVNLAGTVKQWVPNWSAATVADDFSNSATALTVAGATVQWPASFLVGDIIVVNLSGDDGNQELMIVESFSGTGGREFMNVERGQFGTTAATQTSNDQQVRRFVSQGAQDDANEGADGLNKTISFVHADPTPCPQPKIKIVKNVIDHNAPPVDIEDPEDFSFTVTNQTGFDLDDDASSATPLKEKQFTLPQVSGNDDTYTIDETDAGNAGFTLASITCTGAVSLSDTGTADGDIQVTVNNTSDVTCTFVNKKDAPVMRLLKVCKVVENNNTAPTGEGGTFGFTVSGGATASPTVGRTEGQTTLCSDPIAVVEGVATTVSESSFPAGWTNASGFPKVDAYADVPGQVTGSSIVVTVKPGSCDNGTTTDLLTAAIFGADCFVTFTNKMGPVVTPNGTSTVAKTSSNATPNLGDNFSYTITFTVAGGPLSGQKFFSDILPASFEFQGTPLGLQTDPGNYLTCTNTTTALNCNLADQTPIGVYSQVINVHVKTSPAVCGPIINTVKLGADTAQGETAATNTVTVGGCGPITFVKGAGQINPTIVDGPYVFWPIDITNYSTQPQTITIWDPNTTVAGHSCTTLVEAPADNYACTVPGAQPGSSYGVQINLRHAAIPNYNAKCDDVRDSNTAAIAGNFQSSQTVQFIDTADGPAKDCITVSKVKSDTTQPPTWNITITNTGDSAQNVWIVDPDATFSGVVFGNDPCDPVIGTSMTDGIECNVPANSYITITVTKPAPTATCEGTNVDNAVFVWVGTFSVTPEAAADKSDTEGNQFLDLNKDEKLCNRVIHIDKDHVGLNGYVPVLADLPTFKITPNPWSNPLSGDYTVTDDANCDLDQTTWIWTCSIPISAGEVSVSETVPAGWEQCPVQSVDNLLGFVQDIARIVVLTSSWEFCNFPVGKITVIKNDNVTSGNLDVPSDWDFTVTGPNAFSETGTTARLGANPNDRFTISGVPLGDGYDASEDLARFGLCPTIGNIDGNGYQTTENTPGTQDLTQPGQELTFIFTNEDCGEVAGTGVLEIFKVRDVDGDGTQDPGDANIVWTVTITGPEFPGGQEFDVPAAGLVLAGLEEGAYTVAEETENGWVVVGVHTNDGGPVFVGGASSSNVNLAHNETITVTFFNRPPGSIVVDKTTRNVFNNIPTLNTDDDDGWKITVSSNCLKAPIVKFTGQNGQAVFDNLPMCNDYVVTEDPNSGPGGYSPVGGITRTGITPGQVTPTLVEFLNETRSSDPPCTNCGPTTQSFPTPTPTPPTVPTPTSTPCVGCNPGQQNAPTPIPSPTTAGSNPSATAVAGERTPGATPIAPSTGEGSFGSGAGGLNLLLILGGLGALAGGLTFMAMGRKNRS